MIKHAPSRVVDHSLVTKFGTVANYQFHTLAFLKPGWLLIRYLVHYGILYFHRKCVLPGLKLSGTEKYSAGNALLYFIPARTKRL